MNNKEYDDFYIEASNGVVTAGCCTDDTSINTDFVQVGDYIYTPNSTSYSTSDSTVVYNKKENKLTPIRDAMINATQSESVLHPSHYNVGKIEVIDFIEDQKLGFHLGNAVKYICRAGRKDPNKIKEDLDKAIWYINRYKENIK